MLKAANRVFGSIAGNFDRTASPVDRISESALSKKYFLPFVHQTFTLSGSLCEFLILEDVGKKEGVFHGKTNYRAAGRLVTAFVSNVAGRRSQIFFTTRLSPAKQSRHTSFSTRQLRSQMKPI